LLGRKFTYSPSCFKDIIANKTRSMQSQGNANHFVSIGINFGFTILCVVPTWIVISRLEGSHEVRVAADDVVDDVQVDGKSADQA
jgi:hypothetical protein